MKRKLLFGFILAMLLTPWPVAYAYDDGLDGNYPLTVQECEAAHAPHLEVFGNAIGSVTPGDLFLIDSSNITMDTSFILFFTNVDEMVRSFRYMNLAIGIYADTGDGNWEQVAPYGEGTNELYLTMRTGSTEFILTGYSRYKITIDRGCFYSYPMRADIPVAIPEFYLTPT
ncbi:MAG: hypothetical protein MUO19_01775 [Dehalococcoidales bacterium]|nr:hypothetical protein [Dehalococcoidales bacterium]